MNAMKTTIPCKACTGTGRVELNGILYETLVLLRRHPGKNGAQLAGLFGRGCTGAAMCNRLQQLRKSGVAECEKWGRERRWKAK
jgi:hypothetical protein